MIFKYFAKIILIITILSLITQLNSYSQGVQQTVKILAWLNSSNNQNEPEVFFRNVNVVDENGIGRYYYSPCYLPNLSQKLKTIIHSYEFVSFDRVKIRLVYQNILPKDKKDFIYEKSELWKLNFYDLPNYNSFFPLFIFFISENPSREMSELIIYSKLSEISLKDETSNEVSFKKDINKIIFLPDSQFKMFEFPISADGKPYKFFAGHNVLLNVPLNERVHTLEFTIDKYNNFKYNDGKISFNFPFIISSDTVEIKECKIISKYNYEYESSFFNAATTAYPLGSVDSNYYPSYVPIIQDGKSDKGISLIPTLQALLMMGSIKHETKT